MKKPFMFVGAATIGLCLYALAWSAELSPDNQTKLLKNVDAYASRMSDVALKIWSAPELGYQETKTSALLQDELKSSGFKVEAGVAGIPTAFVARAGTSDGPVIAILAEIDALPGMSQAALPERKPIADQLAGHACGHRDKKLAAREWDEGPDPRLWDAGGGRRRRQGLHGAGRTFQGCGCDFLLASRRREQRFAGS